jgi:hypothetical protein
MTWTSICVGCYIGAGLILITIRAVRRFAFSWVLLSISGAFVLAMVYTFRGLRISELSFTDLLSIHFGDALATTLWLSIFTLPVSALVYYSISLFISPRRQPAVGSEHLVAPERVSRTS